MRLGDNVKVMGERLPEAWLVEMHRNGRVEFPLRRWSMFHPVVVPLILVAFADAALGISKMLDDGGWRFLGYLLIVTWIGVAVVLVWQLVTQRPVVVVDHRGIHRGTRRFMAWSEIGSIGLASGPKLARRFPVHPKDVWAKDLLLGQQHVNDLEAFRTWLGELLEERRA